MAKRLISIVLVLIVAFLVTGCGNKADIVSHNIGQEADQFSVLRRIVFVNGITDQYLLVIEGYCSLGNDRTSTELNLTCKTGVGEEYKKHFLGLSDNVTYFVEQLDSIGIDPNHYKVIFRPSSIIPDIEVK